MSAGAVEELVAQYRLVSRGQARLLELVLQVADAAPDYRYGVDEIAFALTLTKAAADAQLDLARQLIRGLPAVFAALSDGQIDLPKARVFADILRSLDRPVAHDVAAQVLPVASHKTTAQLRGMLHRRALAADPAHARKRRERGEQERRVIVEPAADGTATLTALGLPVQRAQAAFERISAIAKARKLSGSTATMDQLRADTLLDLLEGTEIGVAPGPRRGVVELIVGLETLAGLNDEPGVLHGFGPVAADVARRCAAANLGAQWRFSVLDTDGQLLLHGTTRARPTTTPPTPTPTRPAQADAPAPAHPPTRQAQGAAAPVQAIPAVCPAQGAAAPVQAIPAVRPAQGGGVSSQGGPAVHPAQGAAAPAQAIPAVRPAQGGGVSAQGGPAVCPARGGAPRSQTGTTPCSSPPREPTSGPPESGLPGCNPPASGPPRQSLSNSDQLMPGRPVPCPPPQDPEARFPNAAMAAWIRARDRTCRAPGCRIPARACHLDHTTDYARGGRTTHDDLGPLCGRHHTMKHEGGWQLIQTKPGHFIWISPSNRIYYVRPEPP